MKTVIHVIDSLSRGGAETLLVGSVKSLPVNNIIVTLQERNDFGEIENCASVICIGYANNLSIPACVLRLKKIITEKKADVVHSHLFLSSLIARLACPKGIKLIFSIHNLYSEDVFKRNYFSRFIESLIYNKKHIALFVSKSAADDYVKYVNVTGEAIVLYNFIEDVYFDSFLHRDKQRRPLKLVSVGNLRVQKNYMFLLNAIRSVKDKVELDIYGDGPQKDDLQAFINAYGLPVKLMGRVDDISSRLSNYDAFVMGSLYEGYGIALVEAMATGLPLIISDIPVFKEIAGESAIYFNPINELSFVDRINDIDNGSINLGYHSGLVNKVARGLADKTSYINRLLSLYHA